MTSGSANRAIDWLLPLFAVLALAGLLLLGPLPALTEGYSAYTLLGMTGAIFANATGAGGGVVFIPAFAQLGFSDAQSIATSFGIQCFGMTAGAVAWSTYHHRQARSLPSWGHFFPLVVMCSVGSAAGLWLVYGLNLHAPSSLQSLFGVFSLFLGGFILVSLLLHRSSPAGMQTFDWLALALISLGGGVVTAWLSVGVGEFIACYLILRRLDVTLAVAVAVVVSAVSVWIASPQHALIDPQVDWQVLMFAGPGAAMGGLLARRLVQLLGARRLKILFGVWLLVIGLSEVFGSF